ncbi:MAG: hypothetical protein JEZ02_22080 [Desulfatibacillum sp.]|nr:hypothetical protein [Desulfatibacillum sp.]
MIKIVRWEPFPKMKNVALYCEGLIDDWEGFRILLKGNKTPMYRLLFQNPYFYQNRDEEYFLIDTPSEGTYEVPYPFYKIENSELLERFHLESVGICRNFNITHYAIYSGNDCIDILSVEEPIAEVLGDDSFLSSRADADEGNGGET